MNERIQELLKESTYDILGVKQVDHNKFAELIVRECAGVDLYWLSEQDRKAVAEKIKQRFGVE
jgi:hypothetical protein